MVADARARRVHDDAVVVDLHAHAPGFVPRPFADVYRFAVRHTMPADAGFDALVPAGVDALVAKAVGDPVVTRWYRGGAAHAVDAQLGAIETAAQEYGTLVRTVAELDAATARDTLAVFLGVEGADFLGVDDVIGRVDALADRGVRIVVPVHLADNQFGTTCLPWYGFVTSKIPNLRRRPTGLTDLGAELVGALQRRGIIVDVSHADETTTRNIVDATTAPVVATHTGAQAVGGDFARFLADDTLKAIGSTGGVIGLWTYAHGGRGVPDLDALAAHARHIAAVAGVEHLAIGTDWNGVPGTTAGYGGIDDLWRVTAALLAGGFGDADVQAILGGNARRVLAATERH